MPRIPGRQFTDEANAQTVDLAESVGTAKAARHLGQDFGQLAHHVSLWKVAELARASAH